MRHYNEIRLFTKEHWIKDRFCVAKENEIYFYVGYTLVDNKIKAIKAKYRGYGENRELSTPSKSIIHEIKGNAPYIHDLRELIEQNGDIDKEKENKILKEKEMQSNKNYEGSCLVCEVINVTEVSSHCNINQDENKRSTGNYVKYSPSLKVKAGNLVTIDTHAGLRFARVIHVFGKDDILEAAKAQRKAFAWIIDKVNTGHHDKLVKNSERLKELRIEIEARKSAMTEEQELKLLAEADPQAAALIKEMQKIKGE